MASQDFFMKPKGHITMVLHNHGFYDIQKDAFSDDAEIINKVEFPNLIVSNASILMAARMAPGKTTSDVYDVSKNDYFPFGLTHLAIGKGAIVDGTRNSTVATPSTTKLIEEVYRKKFDQWSFINVDGSVSVSPTNILKFSTTFDDAPHGASPDPIPLTEMGLFGGDKDLNGSKGVNETDGGIMFNYKVFPVWNKPKTSNLTIIWKVTF